MRRDGGSSAAAGLKLSVAQKNGSQRAPATGKLQREEQSKKEEVVPAGICVCGLGERNRKDLPSVKVIGWCGSHLCTSATDQVAREVGVALGSC